VIIGWALVHRTLRTEAVLEAVLRYQLDQLAGPSVPGSAAPVCLEVVDGSGPGDPSARMLRRIGRIADVRAISACSVDDRRPRVTSTGEAAVVLGAGPVTWVRRDEARVRGLYLRTPASFARPEYRVVRERRRWVCLGPIVEGLPL